MGDYVRSEAGKSREHFGGEDAKDRIREKLEDVGYEGKEVDFMAREPNAREVWEELKNKREGSAGEDANKETKDCSDDVGRENKRGGEIRKKLKGKLEDLGYDDADFRDHVRSEAGKSREHFGGE